eukprot:CAMPEP_0196132622 /NCGR_PEP_ID=MMETSP0910-20130528/2162_1 /TAXON_ID=49265 /ORGANISM="Thalassiosira rotula, Strain GSO102" /LENGTH=88 /DNA_ID=CAMNT_0041392243 /DNA_START=371 /DNA_END=637 /DNA_ORIENTATION=-
MANTVAVIRRTKSSHTQMGKTPEVRVLAAVDAEACVVAVGLCADVGLGDVAILDADGGLAEAFAHEVEIGFNLRRDGQGHDGEEARDR